MANLTPAAPVRRSARNRKGTALPSSSKVSCSDADPGTVPFEQQLEAAKTGTKRKAQEPSAVDGSTPAPLPPAKKRKSCSPTADETIANVKEEAASSGSETSIHESDLDRSCIKEVTLDDLLLVANEALRPDDGSKPHPFHIANYLIDRINLLGET